MNLTPLVFILGKGGVGKTTASCALAKSLARKGKKVLIVQWALEDSVGPVFEQVNQSKFNFLNSNDEVHFQKEIPVENGVFSINFSAPETIREYFVDHLKQKVLYSLVIENKHVQKLLQAAPGVQELFFLGRIFWLVELAQKERGWKYDHIIVDSQATGHGVSLFGVAKSISRFGLIGPLGEECKRVQLLLSNPQKTSYVIVTLPEELPLQESRELRQKAIKELSYEPLAFFVNRSVSNSYIEMSESFASTFNSNLDVKSKQIFKMIHSSSKLNLELQNNFRNEFQVPVFHVSESHSQVAVLDTWEDTLNRTQGETI